MNVADLTLEQLDYWVAKGLGITVWSPEGGRELLYKATPNLPPRKWQPSRFWSQGGPLIEKFHIDLNWDTEGNQRWSASAEPDVLAQGKTVLEAAMRAFVAMKFGSEVQTAPQAGGV